MYECYMYIIAEHHSFLQREVTTDITVKLGSSKLKKPQNQMFKT